MEDLRSHISSSESYSKQAIYGDRYLLAYILERSYGDGFMECAAEASFADCVAEDLGPTIDAALKCIDWRKLTGEELVKEVIRMVGLRICGADDFYRMLARSIMHGIDKQALSFLVGSAPVAEHCCQACVYPRNNIDLALPIFMQ